MACGGGGATKTQTLLSASIVLSGNDAKSDAMLKGQLFFLTHPFNAPAHLIPGIYRK
jgi:hypothetical protein